MYGIVNQAIEDLVTSSFGQEKWDRVKQLSGVDVDFLSATSHTMMKSRINLPVQSA